MLARVFSGRVRLAALSIALLAAPVLVSAQTPADAPKHSQADPVMARVDGHDIHGSQVMALIRRLPQQTQEVPMEKLVPAMIDTLINTQLIQEAAERANLKDDPEVKRRLALAETEIIRSIYVERLVSKDISEAKLKSEYDEYIEIVAVTRGNRRAAHPGQERGRSQTDRRPTREGRRFHQTRQGKIDRSRRQGLWRRSRLVHQGSDGAGIR